MHLHENAAFVCTDLDPESGSNNPSVHAKGVE